MHFGCIPRKKMKSVCRTQSFSLTNICPQWVRGPANIPNSNQGSLATWCGRGSLVLSICELNWQSRDNTHSLLERERIRARGKSSIVILKFLCIKTVKTSILQWGQPLSRPWFHSVCGILLPFFSSNMLWNASLIYCWRNAVLQPSPWSRIVLRLNHVSGFLNQASILSIPVQIPANISRLLIYLLSDITLYQ